MTLLEQIQALIEILAEREPTRRDETPVVFNTGMGFVYHATVIHQKLDRYEDTNTKQELCALCRTPLQQGDPVRRIGLKAVEARGGSFAKVEDVVYYRYVCEDLDACAFRISVRT